MKVVIVISFFTTIIVSTTNLFGQNTLLFEKLSNKSCFCIDNKVSDSDLLSVKEEKIYDCIQKSYIFYESEMSKEMISFMNINKGSSEYDAGLYIQKNVVEHLIQSCPKFYAVALKKTENTTDKISTETKSEYVKSNAIKICDCVDNLDTLTMLEVDMCILTYVSEEDTEYIQNKEIINELVAYLMGNCPSYTKFAILNREKYKSEH